MSSKEGKFKISVAVRVRPLLGHDRRQQTCVHAEESTVKCYDPEKLFNDKPHDYLRENRTRERQYDFDHVFGPKTTQDEVFERLGAPLIPVVMGGYNATVFAYGQTGSGKTHTMLGEANEPGLMGRTLADLFQRAGAKTRFNVSFIELYNEEIRDLLNPGASSGSGPGLDLREDPTKGPTVAGVTEVPTTSPEQVMALVHEGNGRRRTEGTAANPVSSRSHAVLQVLCEQSGQGGGQGGRRGDRGGRGGCGGGGGMLKVSKLSLIDLAGSERAANTQNKGQRLVEGAMINRSLLALGNCINALSKKGMYVNFRDSKLTRLLKDSLGGNTRTAMVAHVSPSASSFEESLNTLKYAHRARSITSEVRVSWKPVKRQYGEEMRQVREETTRLREHFERTALAASPVHAPDRHGAHGGGGQRDALLDRTSPAMADNGADRGDRGSGKRQQRRPPGTAPADDDDGSGEAVMKKMDALAQTRNAVLANLRGQTGLKQSLMELDDQNVRNRIEMSKIAIKVMPDGNKPSRPAAGGGEQRQSKEEAREARRRRKAKKEMAALKKAIGVNVAKKEELKKELAAQEQAIRPDETKLVALMAQVDASTRDAAQARGASKKLQVRLAAAEHQVSMLEVQKLELEQAGVVHEGMMRERELALEKVQLQVALRDRALAMLCGALRNQKGSADVNAALLGLAAGPVEALFKGLIDPNQAEPTEPARPPGGGGRGPASDDDDDDEEDDDEDEAGGEGPNFGHIGSAYKNLAMSLKRSQISELDDLDATDATGASSLASTGDESKYDEAGGDSKTATPVKRRPQSSRGASRGEGKEEDEGESDEDAEDVDDGADYDYEDDEDDYEEEFEAEPPLASPGPKPNR